MNIIRSSVYPFPILFWHHLPKHTCPELSTTMILSSMWFTRKSISRHQSLRWQLSVTQVDVFCSSSWLCEVNTYCEGNKIECSRTGFSIMMSWHRKHSVYFTFWVGDPLVTGGFIWDFFVVKFNKLLNKQMGCQWFQMPWPLYDVTVAPTNLSVMD